MAPQLPPLARLRPAIPLLYVEFANADPASVPARRLQAEHKQAIAAALKTSLGTVLRKGDLAAAGTGAQWFIALLVARARRRKSLISDADLGMAAERLRATAARALEAAHGRIKPLSARRAAGRQTVRCGWTVLELDGQVPLEALRQAVRGAAVVARIEERRATMLASVTHELRTPLTAIVGFAERLASEDLEDTQKARSIEIIIDESRRLARLAEGLIDVGAWSAGHLRLRREPCDLAALVRKAAESVADRAQGKHLSISVRGSARALADRDRCLQVFLNLLDNAVRHAPEGSVIQVTIQPIRNRCAIAVANGGSGFAPSVRRALGRPFSRGLDGRVGLGLAICRVLVEAHGGRISIAKGNVSKVTVTLPA